MVKINEKVFYYTGDDLIEPAKEIISERPPAAILGKFSPCQCWHKKRVHVADIFCTSDLLISGELPEKEFVIDRNYLYLLSGLKHVGNYADLPKEINANHSCGFAFVNSTAPEVLVGMATGKRYASSIMVAIRRALFRHRKYESELLKAMEEVLKPWSKEGVNATLSLVRKEGVYVANIGNHQVSLVGSNQSKVMIEDEKPSTIIEDEKRSTIFITAEKMYAAHLVLVSEPLTKVQKDVFDRNASVHCNALMKEA